MSVAAPEPSPPSAGLALLVPISLLLACAPQVPAAIEAPPDRPPSEPRADASSGVPAPSFDVRAALADSERLLLALDTVMANREPRVDASIYERMHSGLLEQGLRSLYYYATRAELSLPLLAAILGEPVFVSGPHGEHPNLESADFGRYNPAFVARVAETARALGRDGACVERTRPAFERWLRRQAQTYRLVYLALHHDPEWYAGFRAEYAAFLDGSGPKVDRYDELEPLLTGFQRAGMTWAETHTAIYFWLRRDIDETATLWFEALTALLEAYGELGASAPPGLPG